MGAVWFSFPPDFDRMANDSVDDFGILRTCLRGLPRCYCPLSVALFTNLIQYGVPWIVGAVPRRKDTPLVWP
jgi:hypothetical protein